MPRYCFDIETNGLLPELDTIHCLVLKDVDTGEVTSCSPDQVKDGLSMLEEADELIGHNIVGFDIPAITKVCPSFKYKGAIKDTLVMSRLIFPDIRDRDFRFIRIKEDFPRKLIGSHSLRAWGYRILNYKGDYEGGWETWTPEMQEYCEQDVEVTAALWDKLLSKKPSDLSVQLEHDVATIIRRQEEYGFAFDIDGARRLYGDLLGRRTVIASRLSSAFPPWEVLTPFTPKRDNQTLGYKKGITVDKSKIVEFNPGSRDHIAQKLQEKYGWKPKEWTQEGKPKVDEAVLAKLPYEEAKLLAEYLTLTKRLGQIGDGKQAWINLERSGRVHGRVNTNGAVTGRMTHSHPNMAQVPSVRAIYGKECRSLFKASSKSHVLIGCDADALELRCLAGYMAHYDKGAYIKTVLEGDKSQGTDMHTINANVLECDRDTAKTWFYAFIYGAGDAKLGAILGKSAGHGKKSRQRFLESLPALAKLSSAVKRKVKDTGNLIGIDGRKLEIRSEHAALNTLLQSAGAIFMKQGLVILDKRLQEAGFKPSHDYEFVANVHDEWQIEAKKEHAERVGEEAVQAIKAAGDYFNFACPLDAQYVIGTTWADTH